MKPNRLTVFITLLFCVTAAFAQKDQYALLLKDGIIVPKANINSTHIDSLNTRTARLHNKTLVVIQFEQLPSEERKKELAASGVQLLNYLPNNAYTATITGKADILLLQRAKARALFSLSPQQKMHPSLSKGNIPAWAQKTAGTIEVWINFPKTFSATEVLSSLKELNIDVLSTAYERYQILVLRIAANRLTALADLPFVEYVQPAPRLIEPLLNNSRRGSRANVLNTTVANGGRGLNGEGIVIGIGDTGNVNHVDLTGREIDRSSSQDNYGHAFWTNAAVAGAGIKQELYRGYASKATIVNEKYQNIIINAPVYVQDFGMVITNNSYGIGFDCNYNGVYDLYAQVLDQQAFDLPYLQNVFSAGNSGNNTCPPYPAGFKTVLGSYQAAKNIICVGNADDQGNIFYSSSKGPVKDGRLKPDVVADGTAVTSAWLNNGYYTGYGTSISAPAVTGGLALLYQRYRQLNGNANPKSALMKALICNGATDKGNSGPDFSYGYGNLNLLRSIDMLDNYHYFNGNSTSGSVDVQTISVPANTAQLKVMLYWHDPAASLLSTQALVNDLDLEVYDPSSNTILPKKLDTTAANVTAIATTGADHINNMEQVVIDNPVSGNYTIRVKGTAIAQNPSQEYYVVYDAVPVALQITYPTGGEGLVPGETQKISWEAYGNGSNTFNLQYSTDNGTTWNDIATNISAATRFYTWTVPAVTTDKALVRVIENGSFFNSTSHPFTMIGLPTVSLSATQCESYIAINWNAVANATDYEIMMLRGTDMVSMATTTSTNYTFNSLSKDSTYWVSVRARINGQPGRRAIAVFRQPNNGNCSGNISDNDLKLNAIVTPVSGRKFTSTQLTATSPVQVQIKNLDDNPITGFTVKYAINNGSWVSESVAATITAGSTYNYTFNSTADFSAVGNYTLVAVVKNNIIDTITANDTLVTVIKQLDNQPINLNTPFLDDLENAATATYQKDTIGLAGVERYDFHTTSPYGRLRTFVNRGLATSGTRSFTLDKTVEDTTATQNYMTGTFNLSNYNAAVNDIRLDFQYAFIAQTNDTVNNSIWARGNDTQPWVKVYSSLNFNGQSLYQLSPGLALAHALNNNGQNLSSSTQIRWGQNAAASGSDQSRVYSIDDIHLYEAINDMQMLSIDSPANLSCALGAAVPVKVNIKNSSNAVLNNIPVKYSINGGAWVSETIPAIAANTTVQYTFNHTVDFSANGVYTISTLVDYPTDNYRLNDTLTKTLRNSPLVNSFPYLQNFEGGDGGWYAEGANSSWQYGTPASPKINRAASGAKAWKTNLSGNYNDNELSYLYSPCFDIGSMSRPALSFSLALDLEDCGSSLCDAAWVEYTTDGSTWKRLIDTTGAGTNWYNAANKTLWSVSNYTRWHVATMLLPTGVSRIRIRFVLNSDPGVNREGVGIDDIHIYDNIKGIYTGTTLASPVTQTINGGTAWTDFESGGKLIASVQPNNQNMGATNAQVYINTSGVRDTGNQYYHNRNITIKPASRNLSDSVSVRFYFLDGETESLINAAGCANCIKPSTAYELGISKYNNIDTSVENGTIKDNKGGAWSFFNSGNIAIVPFDKGYYAECKVTNFSEFWLSKNPLGNTAPLPLQLLDFTVQKAADNKVLVQWKTDNETDMDRYEIEVAQNNDDLQTARFKNTGTVKSENYTPQHLYSFTDAALPTGVRYYRLKMIDKDGAFRYSIVKSVVFSNRNSWVVYPNPSDGLFQLIYQVNAGETLNVKLTDAVGRPIRQFSLTGNGFIQKQSIDISGKRYAAGVYLLQAVSAQEGQSFKLYKQ